MKESCRLIGINDFIKTTLTGTIDIKKSVMILNQVLELERIIPKIAVFIDARRAQRGLESRDFYDLAEIIATSGLKREQPIALINRSEDIYHSKFLESNLAERGFLNFKAFDSIDSAIEWIQPTSISQPFLSHPVQSRDEYSP